MSDLTYTLHFTQWECGHHAQRPDDIPVETPEQALLILRAISHAISQPGSARAVLFNDTHGYADIYLTDDYVDDDQLKRGPVDRPVVICGDGETIAQIMGEGLKQAREDISAPDLYDVRVWDGAERVDAYQTVLTAQTREQVESAIAEREDAYPPREPLFELPPVFFDAAPLLERLRVVAAEWNAYEAQLAAEDARDEAAETTLVDAEVRRG